LTPGSVLRRSSPLEGARIPAGQAFT